MKITKVARFDESLFFITKEPSWIESLFGFKKKVEAYKIIEDKNYTNHKDLTAVIRDDGSVLSYSEKEVIKINDYLRKKKYWPGDE